MRFPKPIALVLLAGCATGPVYPPRPPATAAPPLVEPLPSRIVLHAAVAHATLVQGLEAGIPRQGTGSFNLAGSRSYQWQREGLEVRYADHRVDIRTRVQAAADLPLLGRQAFPLELHVLAEPFLSPDYRAGLQNVTVEVTSSDPRLRAAQGIAGALDVLKAQIQDRAEQFKYDLKPQLAQAHARLTKPIEIPLGDARGCASLAVTGIEAGPTIFADGVEKDVAVVVKPSFVLPCPPPAPPAQLPPLANVPSLPTGPFTVTVPIAASYAELAKAMTLAFTDGKLFFSKDFPELYLAEPEIYASGDQLVLKLRLRGNVAKAGIKLALDGDIYFAGHPAVVDNELRIPDLQPTIETSSFLLKLKAAVDAEAIRRQAREALRLDIGERVKAARAKLSTDLALGDGLGCLRADVAKIEVTGLHAHASYLRMYVAVTAQLGVHLPCPAR